MKIRVALAGVLAVFSLSAQAVVIDFDSESIGAVNPLDTDGFTFEQVFSYGSQGMEVIEQSPGDNALHMSITGGFTEFGDAGPIHIKMSASSDSPFAFYGADFLPEAAVGDVLSAVIGYKVGGGTAVGAFGTGDWLNLESVWFETASCCGMNLETLSITIDNVDASVVPIPAAVWLFGSALAGLGWMRRKQTV